MRGIQRTPELRRIANLPRRQWSDADAAEVADELTQLLRTTNGQQILRPIQGVALAEAGTYRGLVASARVGTGKTLISLLAPVVLAAKNPLLILPAKLIGKTLREIDKLREHWRLPEQTTFVSYEKLGHPKHVDYLSTLNPDVIVADEVHKIKNPKSAVTKRVMRFLCARPEVPFVAMTGTITTRSLRNYAHILLRALGELSPLPDTWSELEEWCCALDENVEPEARLAPGALLDLFEASELKLYQAGQRTEAARGAYRRRLIDTPGVVATTGQYTGSSLTIQGLEVKPPKVVTDALNHLRKHWELPDGRPLSTGIDVWRHLRELAMGLYYRWDPAPPKSWLDARKNWCAECRYILGHNQRKLDSESVVRRAVEKGLYPQAKTALEEWLKIEPTFTVNQVAVWLDPFLTRVTTNWGKKDPGIVWVEHAELGEYLTRATGYPYFNNAKQNINACEGQTVIASIHSQEEGKNLQAWSRNLVLSPPVASLKWEQVLGRTHREGQEADEVTCDVVLTCPEHRDHLEQARDNARFVEQTTGAEQKLLTCDWLVQ